jgi:hypothetical protein
VKEKSVYKRVYKKKELKDYNLLLERIKADNYDELPSNDPFKKKYLGYDTGFITITSVGSLTPKGYHNPDSLAEITIEKIGPDIKNQSEIEKILVEKGFKKE